MEYIKIRNFGPISEVDITLKKVNIFIGEQGVGKSTLAKLLSCCRDFILYFMILNEENNENVMKIFGRYGLQGYFKEDTIIEYHEDDSFQLKYCNGHFDVSHDRISREKLNDFMYNIISSCIEDTCKILGTPIEIEKMDLEEIKKIIPGKIPLILSNLRTSLYCPAERSIVSIMANSLASMMLNKIPLPYTLLEYMSFFEKARQEFTEFNIPFLKLSYSFEDGKNAVTVNDASVKLEYASSGIQSVLPLLMVIEYCLQHKFFSSFTIEEPELNLFPTNQLHLIQTLIAKTNREDTSLGSWTITTHSPYLLSVFNISLLAGRITEKFPDATDRLSELIQPGHVIKPDEISVYELTRSSSPYCRSIIDENTGLIKSNYLDSVSDIISADFNRLYKLYIQLTKNAK